MMCEFMIGSSPTHEHAQRYKQKQIDIKELEVRQVRANFIEETYRDELNH